jgi:hypothetical protein
MGGGKARAPDLVDRLSSPTAIQDSAACHRPPCAGQPREQLPESEKRSQGPAARRAVSVSMKYAWRHAAKDSGKT